MRLTFLGAAGTVTGSKYLVSTAARRVLVDCGLFQGEKRLRLRNWEPLPIRADAIDAVVLTHAHLDHAGYVPLLVKAGFAGRVFCSDATLALSEILLRDAGRIQEEDAEHANRWGWSKHKPARPLYTEADARAALERFTPIPWHTDHYVGGGMTVRLARAGHILGAATVRVRADGSDVVFSGDIGRPNDPIFPPPEDIGATDTLVVESTYGDRTHAPDDGGAELAAIVRRTAARGGVVIVPAFAIGRAQQLLYTLFCLRRDGAIPEVPIFLNSPMATDAGAIFCAHPADHRLDMESCHGMCSVARIVRSPAESRALNERSGPMIVVSASGMLTGGRVLHHVRAFGSDPRSTILLVGYQAAGTRGRALQDGTRRIRIHGEDVDVRAEIRTLPSLSAHADANEILGWLRALPRAPGRTFVTHGEPPASHALAARIERDLGWRASVPTDGETIDLGVMAEAGDRPASPPSSVGEPGPSAPCCPPRVEAAR